MLSRSTSFLRSCVRKRILRNTQQKQRQQQQQQFQRRAMGGGGAYMETNAFGTRLGEAFGTVAWLWIFYRFSQDGRVLLGYEHPWDHGGGHDDHGGDDVYSSVLRVQDNMNEFTVKKQTKDVMVANWDKFSDKAINPGEDDDDDDDDDDEEEDEDDDDDDEE